MEGLALGQLVQPLSWAACTSSPSLSRSSSATLRVRIASRAPLLKLTGANYRCSPALKVHASKKTFSSFQDMIANSEVPVLVDFYAVWCGPCQIMAPVLKDVGTALKDKISVVKVDTEKYPNVASRYGIQALPTFVLFMNGRPVNFLEGAQTKEKLIDHILKTLKAEEANVKY